MIYGLAVNNRMRARRIIGHHPPNCRAAAGRHIGCKLQSVWFEKCIEFIEHYARFDPDPTFFGIEVENAIHVFRHIHHNTASHHTAGKPGATATGNERRIVFIGQVDDLQNILFVFGQNNANRFNLIHARICAVKNARHLIKPHFALNFLHQHSSEVHRQSSSLDNLTINL